YQASINLLKTHDKLAGYSGYGQDGQDLIIMLLDNSADSYCWDVQLPESQGDGEAVASDIPRPRPAASDFQTRTFGAWRWRPVGSVGVSVPLANSSAACCSRARSSASRPGYRLPCPCSPCGTVRWTHPVRRGSIPPLADCGFGEVVVSANFRQQP